ncbi:hypothetical protein LSTR_LSTR013272 [Laodelphax striatellus]|uniref:Uncharacterized protein n=1 Tax=Laodelphax striatellus TaxID=195883 RepID=A0A482XAP4_LAOST|nr:hypothetical protein LSTR_LSTR013272 [Laodelphax striatellus]
MDGESMDDETVVVLAVQLAALTCIAGSLLLYLLCKIRGGRRLEYDAEFTSLNVGTGRSVLVTSAESAFGLQLVLHLSALGFRVFAGIQNVQIKEGEGEEEEEEEEENNVCKEEHKEER